MAKKLPNPNTPSPDSGGPMLTLPMCLCMGPAAGLLLYFLMDGLQLGYCLLIGTGVGAAIGLLVSAFHKK